MRLLFALYTSFLASKLPCHPSLYSWSKEHVAPKSLFPPIIAHHPDNIIPLPTKLNNARGNRPYTNQIDDGYLVYACKDCPHPGFCSGAAMMTKHGIIPPDVFKGPIARSVLKSIDRFPKFTEKISQEVLDYDLAIEWDRRYPMTVEEYDYRSNSK